MPDHRQIKRNGSVSNPSVEYIEDAIRRLKIQSNEKHDGDGISQENLYPDRPGEPDCIYYLRTGSCGYGTSCRFNHPSIGQVGQYGGELPERVGQPDCEYFLKTGTCKYGSTCKYNHPGDRRGAEPILLNILGLPMRQEEKSCSYYMRTGSCKFGMACKFNHPQPAPPYVSNGLSVVPSSSAGLPYDGAPQPWSVPRTTFMAHPRSHAPQTYLPLVISSSQAIVPPLATWNAYPGSMSPVSPTVNGQFPPAFSELPERPDEPECRYFMNNGSCKFGSDCKYNHPREKIAQLASSSLGPLGLPLRPGQAACSYYSLYGLCKYGPTCKFDHPLMGYSYNYNMNIPAINIPDPSRLTYQTTSPTIQLSKVSPSKFRDFPHKSEFPNNNPLKNASTPQDSPQQPASPLNSLPDQSD
jgi:hypothetical protein